MPRNILRPCFAQKHKLQATPLCTHANVPFLLAAHMTSGMLRSAWCPCKMHCLALCLLIAVLTWSMLVPAASGSCGSRSTLSAHAEVDASPAANLLSLFNF